MLSFRLFNYAQVHSSQHLLCKQQLKLIVEDEHHCTSDCSKGVGASTLEEGRTSFVFDTIRRRLQMQSEKPKEEWTYKGTTDCFKQIVKNEGGAALGKGAGANALRTVGSAMVLVLYDQLQLLFAK
jgi:hypothetical protein